MEEIPFGRTYLESLATAELVKMADILGLDILDNRERAFVIEELLDAAPLDASFIDGDKYVSSREDEVEDVVLVQAAPLSKQYNISFIEVMIRDPLWAFVFWEIKSAEDEQSDKAPDFNGCYLKVSPVDKSGEKQKSNDVFTIPVRKGDTARYLALTNTVDDGTSGRSALSWTEQCQYIVEFCANSAGSETVLAVSNPVRLPGQPVLSAGDQLGHLSGYGDFQVIRKSERTLRAKGIVSTNE